MIIGLNTGGLRGRDEAHIADFVKQTSVTFPIAQDTGTVDSWSRGSSISPFPLDVVINREGKVVYLTRQYNADELKTVIEQALQL